MLAAAEGAELLRIARAALEAHFAGRRFRPQAATNGLRQARGAFVSLHVRCTGELRGCIGSLEPGGPLADAVGRAAVAAATRDPRFPPVEARELAGLRLDVSVLSELQPVRPEAVQVGVHGLLVRRGTQSGVLLPQVPVEHGWGPEEFLRQTCRKAGLPADAWRRPDCELLGFEADVFRE